MTTPVDSSTVPPGTIVTDPPPANTVSDSTDQSQLNDQQFLQLLVAQLQYQDPSQPVDNSTLMNETATLSQIQTMQQLAQASASQMQAQQQQTAAGMVGLTVSYADQSGKAVTGYVSAANISGSSPSLVVDGKNVALSQVQQVLDPNAPPPTTPSTPST